MLWFWMVHCWSWWCTLDNHRCGRCHGFDWISSKNAFVPGGTITTKRFVKVLSHLILLLLNNMITRRIFQWCPYLWAKSETTRLIDLFSFSFFNHVSCLFQLEQTITDFDNCCGTTSVSVLFLILSKIFFKGKYATRSKELYLYNFVEVLSNKRQSFSFDFNIVLHFKTIKCLNNLFFWNTCLRIHCIFSLRYIYVCIISTKKEYHIHKTIYRIKALYLIYTTTKQITWWAILSSAFVAIFAIQCNILNYIESSAKTIVNYNVGRFKSTNLISCISFSIGNIIYFSIYIIVNIAKKFRNPKWIETKREWG